MRRETNRFPARSDGGDEIIIVEWTTFHAYRSNRTGGLRREVAGNIDLETDEREPVNRLSDELYEVVTTGIRYRRLAS